MTIPPAQSTPAQSTPAQSTPAQSTPAQSVAAQTPVVQPGTLAGPPPAAPPAASPAVSIPVSVTEPAPATTRPLDPPAPTPLRIGNASGFYGDRFDAMREMLTGGPLDVLTGDYLAELTMLILGRSRLKDPSRGYASTFLRQLEEGLGLAVERGVKIVTNAGGLNPAGLADSVRELAEKLGISVRVAHVEGDAQPVPEGFLTANAYLGGAGIAACLKAGADIVVTGRVTDAALVTGPAAAHFGWGPDDLDALAGAVVAGHVLECGTQATGGNYAFFGDHDVRRPGFPLAEIHADGSSVITKHPGTGGVVDLSTVTAQLLYETGGARYAGPDVTARLDTVTLAQEGQDRVGISGVRGEAPPPTLKVGLNRLGGWRNEVVFVLTGLDIEAKSRLVREQFADALERSGKAPAEVRWELARTDHPDAPTEETASALLRLVVRDQDAESVGRVVSGAAVELALGSYPGFHVTAPPGKGAPYGVFEAVAVAATEVAHTAVLPDGTRQEVPAPAVTLLLDDVPPPAELPAPLPPEVTRSVPLGLLAGARSGDKGGDANVGVWVRDDHAWRWLAHELTVQRFQELLPETKDLVVERHVLPHLRAVNFVVRGLLGEGVAAQARFDPQAKALGEWLRSRHLAVPVSLLGPG
ncbi:acyclic terpene utilization AtuA family protein [Streptomyces sp. AM 2-1-1]|uniref:acyclic terpene utilization AtuA family protein n=1 Tax=Streptomyces sp. AM 2-1-1 TaxID=3028709 RepID=UPI0023B8928F|nr:acyclic terpene utilization AtuA family protein [Streptomyces sp. AM 2-1-1]WEH41286.1 DUF1446 domain-containing protein [Streptomyces sp. AM 2-1-1]